MTIHPADAKGKIPVHSFKHDETLIFTYRDIDPNMCDLECDCWKHFDDTNDEEDEEEKEDKSWKKKICKLLLDLKRKTNPSNMPWVKNYKIGLEILIEEGLLPPEDSSIISWSPNDRLSSCKVPTPFTTPTPISKTNSTTKITTRPTISLGEVGLDGKLKAISQVEEVLKWKTKNAKAQNALLMTTYAKIEKITTRKYYKKLQEDISHLEEDFKMTTFGEESNKIKRGIRKLKY
ncbi:hypothetical protein CR513_10510, partial [Mucuna pruriens]